MADLFKEILPSILQTKKQFMFTDVDEKSYPAFMVNRALSYHSDTTLVANQLNTIPNIDNKMQADFLLNTVRSYKRPYAKWFKAEKNDDIKVVMQAFGYSQQKALDALKLLSNEQLNAIKTKMLRGRNE
jgi:hypothetical protein